MTPERIKWNQNGMKFIYGYFSVPRELFSGLKRPSNELVVTKKLNKKKFKKLTSAQAHSARIWPKIVWCEKILPINRETKAKLAKFRSLGFFSLFNLRPFTKQTTQNRQVERAVKMAAAGLITYHYNPLTQTRHFQVRCVNLVGISLQTI